ncbi:hypothetical protein QBC42DRAFT_250347 [Cladorrhinum samala]|uniref:Infection structure specific protein n=1 Tax=Cladorrhinum samala TaxID=585594 RepID=A0AAV9HVW1_9PEZI|nr:hypothetical protein QBC42DRAFT_250347 [Cladorrhinum samala]
MHLSTLILAGAAAATVAVAQTTTPAETSSASSVSPTTTEGPCSSLYRDFLSKSELNPPSVLYSWLESSASRYKETHTVSTVTTVTRQPPVWPPTEEQISSSCSVRLAGQTLSGDLPESVATVYSSYTSEWSSFVAATGKTQAQSIASVCSSSGETVLAGFVLINVATAMPDCISAWWLLHSDVISTSPGGPQSTSTGGATPTASTPATGGAAKETGVAFAAVMAVAGVVGML